MPAFPSTVRGPFGAFGGAEGGGDASAPVGGGQRRARVGRVSGGPSGAPESRPGPSPRPPLSTRTSTTTGPAATMAAAAPAYQSMVFLDDGPAARDPLTGPDGAALSTGPAVDGPRGTGPAGNARGAGGGSGC